MAVPCLDCFHQVSRLYPETGEFELMEELSHEHAPNCPAVLWGLTDEEGPWNTLARKYRASHAARPPQTVLVRGLMA